MRNHRRRRGSTAEVLSTLAWTLIGFVLFHRVGRLELHRLTWTRKKGLPSQPEAPIISMVEGRNLASRPSEWVRNWDSIQPVCRLAPRNRQADALQVDTWNLREAHPDGRAS